MTPNEAIDLVRDAILMSLIIGAPLLLVGMLVGLAIGLIQALTQIQDQTVSTVPKLVAMTLAIIVCLPWLTDRMLDYSRNVLRELPSALRASTWATQHLTSQITVNQSCYLHTSIYNVEV